MGLERASKFEEALLLEFGRGFRYTRPLRVNVMDLDYELRDELVGRSESEKLQCIGYRFESFSINHRNNCLL